MSRSAGRSQDRSPAMWATRAPSPRAARSPMHGRAEAGSLRDAEHRDVLWWVRGIPDPYDLSPGESRCPDTQAMRAVGDRWRAAAADLAALADALERASARLSRTKPERGPVRALRERIEQIVWLARELAFRCDSEHVKPEPPPGGPVMGSDLDRGLRQLWIHLADAVERLGTEASIPRLPWDGGRYGTDFGVTWDDHEARYVVFLNRPRQDGTYERVEHRVEPDRMHALYESGDVYAIPRHLCPTGGRSGPATEQNPPTVGSERDDARTIDAEPTEARTIDAGPTEARTIDAGPTEAHAAVDVRLPATALDAHELFLLLGLHLSEQERARAAAEELADVYAEVAAEFPAAVPPPASPASEQAAPVAHRAGRWVRKPEAPRRPVAQARGARGLGG